MEQVIEKPISEFTADELENLLKQKRAEEINRQNVERANYETLKHETVTRLVGEASALHDQMTNFKRKAFSDMRALYDLLCQYSKRHADGKGNFSIETPEGLKISYKNQELGYFDERSAQAEKHIIDFVNSYYKDHDKSRKLITSLLERRKGKLDIKLVQKLYAMENEFDDANWREGIKLLKESWTASESKSYINFEVKRNDQWESINLHFGSIRVEG